MNKGRIHKDLGNFLGVLQNLFKLDDKTRSEVRDFNIFGKKTSRKIHGIKITQFRSVFVEKSRNEIKIKKFIAKREKTVKFSKI